MLPKSPDYLAEAGTTTRIVAVFLLVPFALVLSCVAILDVIATAIMTARQQWDALGAAMVTCLVASVLSVVVWWVAILLLRGTRSANRITILPSWFIQIVGILMTPGQAYVVWFLYSHGQSQLGRISLNVLGGTVSMIFIPWLVRKRARKLAAQAAPAHVP